MQEESKQKILAFLKNHKLMVISTIDMLGNKPESAVVAFCETNELEIIFGTSNKTRKYKNLQNNQNVSFVIGWDSRLGTFQSEGVARELSLEESKKYSELMIKKNPVSGKFVQREDQRYFVIKPNWVRLLDMSIVPDVSFEAFL